MSLLLWNALALISLLRLVSQVVDLQDISLCYHSVSVIVLDWLGLNHSWILHPPLLQAPPQSFLPLLPHLTSYQKAHCLAPQEQFRGLILIPFVYLVDHLQMVT